MTYTPSDLAKMLHRNPDLRVEGQNDKRSLVYDQRSLKLTEHDLQVALIAECDRRALTNPLWGYILAIPNGGQRTKSQGGKLKAEGVRAGIPDLMVAVARHGYHGLFLELKISPNKPSQSQLDWIRKLNDQGYFCFVAWNSVQKAIEALEWYIGGDK